MPEGGPTVAIKNVGYREHIPSVISAGFEYLTTPPAAAGDADHVGGAEAAE